MDGMGKCIELYKKCYDEDQLNDMKAMTVEMIKVVLKVAKKRAGVETG